MVVPTIGRPSLVTLLRALQDGHGPVPGTVFVVDDRGDAGTKIDLLALSDPFASRIRLLATRRKGPAAARNVGWRASRAEWVAFLDDDVVPTPRWKQDLEADLIDLPADVAGSQGNITVPLPHDRPPTDWERNVAGLESGQWITADMAYRRNVLEEVGGFDERFIRAYREDADLALRVRRAGYALVVGRRRSNHPVRPASPWVSVRLQAGNADDVLMRALHGDWDPEQRRRGRKRAHVLTTVTGITFLAALALRRRRMASVAGLVWSGGTARFAWARIAPGPRDPKEIATMVLTSVVIPPAATAWLAIGLVRWRLRTRAASASPG
ncbi:MAG: glycosyltransferase [Actinomycetota bacterium]|nr:glycosyltransferase [Actinomycetota bacterium]